MTAPTTNNTPAQGSTVNVPRLSTVINKAVDNLLGDVLANPRVTKLVSWGLVVAGWFDRSGTVRDLLVGGGLAGHIVQALKEP